MRSSAIRRVLHLELVLSDYDPAIVRVVAIDPDLTLGDLTKVLRAALDLGRCTRHLYTRSRNGDRWPRQRWGDRWTMIDLRDPTVIDETTARISTVLGGGEPLWFSHTCDSSFAVRIVAGIEEFVHATDAPVRIVSGERAAPLPCTRGPLEHSVLLDILGDAEHPQHEALQVRLAAAVGPWVTFNPAQFDSAQTKLSLDGAAGGAASHGRAGRLDRMVDALPRAVRPGLRAHLSSAGLELPAVVTVHEAERMLSELSWVLTRASGAGVVFTAGTIDPVALREGADSLGVSTERVTALFATARGLRFMYSRRGHLITNKAVSVAIADPIALWSKLACAVFEALPSSDRGAYELLLFAVADGDAANPAFGMSRAADAFAMISPYTSWSSADDECYGGGCNQTCDCPRVNGTNWHDVVDSSIRDAASTAAQDESRLVVSQLVYQDDVNIPREWADVLAEIHGSPTAWSGEPSVTMPRNNEAAFLDAAAPLVELLSLFGLAHEDDGSWTVPPTLQQFAHSALQNRRQAW
ncbi:IS1096 element passenger TnpR family protein (plasmid) [Coraliomargarita sp. W4R53]